MKGLIILATLLVSFAATATNTYEAKTTTCAELQEALAAEKTIKVKLKWFGTGTHYSDRSACNRRMGYEAVTSYSSSSDNRFCRVGYSCNRVHSDR